MKEYPCQKSSTGTCKYGGNKVYNYGFMSGASPFCRHPEEKRFIDKVKYCPISKIEVSLI